MSEFTIKDRIVKFVRVKASSVIPSPWNFRVHPDKQKSVLRDIFEEIGIAGALIGREVEGGKYALIDGHLRREELGDQKVPLLVTDLTEEEAKKLLAVYDPISGMAETDKEAYGELVKQIDTDSPNICSLFSELGSGSKALKPEELELDLEEGGEGEKGEEKGPKKELEASHVRMHQLFLNANNIGEFEEMVAEAGEKYGTKNSTDTIMTALQDVTGRLAPKKKKKERIEV